MSDAILVVHEFYSALRDGDVARAVAVLSPDLEWTEAEGFAYYSGTWRGPQAVVDNLLVPLARDWTSFSVTAHEFLAMDDRVVSFGTYARNPLALTLGTGDIGNRGRFLLFLLAVAPALRSLIGFIPEW
jgi:ketosteroid isomerase-like protein